MNFWIFLAAAAAVILLYPYLRVTVKRIIMTVKLQKLCKKLGYTLYPTHHLWFFGDKHNNSCDLHIETPHEIYSVKLFSMKSRNAELVFKWNGKYYEYFIRNFLCFTSNIGALVQIPMEKKAKPFQAYDFNRGYKQEWYTKIHRRILLVNPVCREIRLQTKHDTEILRGSGDEVNGAQIYSLSRFLGELEHNEDWVSGKRYIS